ncbi:MAG: methyltransferase domain-containing protein, partial [Planctomycetota bacterium]
IESIEADALVLRTRDFEPGRFDFVFLNFSLDDQPYFISAPLLGEAGRGRLRVGLPSAIYQAERRGRVRRPPDEGGARRVRLEWPRGRAEGEVADASPEGLGVWVTNETARDLGEAVRVHYLDGRQSGELAHGEVRNRVAVPARRGWTRIGLDIGPAPRGERLRVERRERVLDTSVGQRAGRRWQIATALARVAADRALGALGRRVPLPGVRIVDYANEAGENIRAVVDSWGDTRGATAVVIPPAWGRTKETLMPLAATIVASFRAAREPVVVLRFDGIRKRGESYRDPECRGPGREHHRFTFSQGVRDIVTTLDFLERSPEFRPGKTVLVSFSAASIESRRAVATDPRIDGWICVVGAADTQSMMRVISGGVDYVAGVDRGVRFGLQQVLGVEVDIDHAGADLFEQDLPFLSDARRDFARIRVPVTWIHGIHDAWMDPERAQDALSRGDAGNRRFIQVPTGHMLKTSAEALDTFQLIAGEVASIALSRRIDPVTPDLGTLDRRQRAERRRLPRSEQIDLREFWEDYLVGPDGGVGIELMTHTAAYRELMAAQVDALALEPGQVVADLGSGTGAFELHLARTPEPNAELDVISIDFVRAGLMRSRLRLAEARQAGHGRPRVWFAQTDLDVHRGQSFPLASGSFDRVLAGLFLSYVSDPMHVLREIHRVLRPGGRIVVSCLRRDADVSKLFAEGIQELRADPAQLGEGVDLDRAARSYLNQASRLLDLEETGRFRFWDLPELERLLASAGFEGVSGRRLFGQPPQAVLVSAHRS